MDPNTHSSHLLTSDLTSSTDGAENQGVHADEQLTPDQTLGPLEDSEEKENGGMSAVNPPSGISNTGPSDSLEHHEQESASKVLQDGDLASQTEKDQPTLRELAHVMEKVLDVLQNSTIASMSDEDNRYRFWGLYGQVAAEHDQKFLDRYTNDMESILLFSGLFSTVSSSFIVAMESNLSPDPSDTTNALLAQLVQIGLGNLVAAGSTPVDPASTWSPPASAVRIQMIAYASLSMSLLAAFGAVLGRQWLGYYKFYRYGYGRGSLENRGKRRQEMFDGLVTWYFDAVVQSFPVLLQVSVLLFEIALGAHMWYQQPSIAWVIIATTVSGFLFYLLTVMACLISPSCPFQTPMSMILCMSGIDRVLRPVFKRVFNHFQQLKTSAHGILGTLKSSWTGSYEVLAGPVYASGAFARRSLQLLSAVLHRGLRSLAPRPSTKVGDSEAQPPDQDPDVLVEEESILTLDLRDISTSDLEAPSIKWLLETSTDPEVVLATAKLVPQVEWPLDLDVSDMLHQLSDIFTSCVDIQGNIVPSLEEKASACTTALTHLYYGRVLQAHPGCDDFIARDREDADVFWEIFRGGICTTDRTVLHTTINLCSPNSFPYAPLVSEACPDSVLERLSHLLPYHFVTGRTNTDIEDLAITVISKLLSSPSPPSTQNIANCTLLACVMVGTQVDKKDIIRIDKSSFLPKLSGLFLPQFQKALWAWDGGELDEDSTGVARRAWNLLDVICRILELAGYHDPSSHTMRNLEVCRKIYSRVRSSGQNDASVSLAALRKALHFTFAAANVSRDPSQLWDASLPLQRGSRTPEDFDWLVDYLDYIYAADHEAAYDILLLLGSMGVSCSPAKQHLFVQSLIACMDSNMPPHLRHTALRAAHSARDEIASINAIDDASLWDTVLCRLSSAILSVLFPHPGTAPTNDDPDHFFDYDRDLCYVELVCALARNSNWRPHLSEDHHIDRCISMIPKYCNYEDYSQHAFYIAGILLQITPAQMSVPSLDSITEQQWWDVMRCAWYYLPYTIRRTHDFELLVLVERTKKYMQNASKSNLSDLIRDVDDVLEMGPEMQGLEQQEGVIIAVKELRDEAKNMRESLVEQ